MTDHTSCIAFVSRYVEFLKEHRRKNPSIKIVRISEGIVLIDGDKCKCNQIEKYISVTLMRSNTLEFKAYIPQLVNGEENVVQDQ